MNSDSIDTGTAMGLNRPSIRVARASALLEVDISTIYKLVRAGALEAHRVGKRGVRVFADSLRNYQEQQKITAGERYTADTKSKTINRPAYDDALAYLRSI